MEDKDQVATYLNLGAKPRIKNPINSCPFWSDRHAIFISSVPISSPI